MVEVAVLLLNSDFTANVHIVRNAVAYAETYALRLHLQIAGFQAAVECRIDGFICRTAKGKAVVHLIGAASEKGGGEETAIRARQLARRFEHHYISKRGVFDHGPRREGELFPQRLAEYRRYEGAEQVPAAESAESGSGLQRECRQRTGGPQWHGGVEVTR